MVELNTLGSVIKTTYEGETNTEAYTTLEQAKLAGIEENATADQTPEELIAAVGSVTNPLAFSQGLHVLASSAGSNGIQIVDDDNINFGISDFTINVKCALPYWVPGADQTIYHKHDGSNGIIVLLLATGILRVTINAVNYDSTVAVSAIDGMLVNTCISVRRENAYGPGAIDFYQDASSLGPEVVIPIGTPATVDNTSTAYVAGTSLARTEGVYIAARLYNYAMSAAAVLDLYNNGVAFEDADGGNVLNSLTKWKDVAPQLGEAIDIRALVILDGKIYGGTQPTGRLYEWNGTDAWVEVASKLGSETHILSLAVLDGKIYGGTYPNGKLYEWNGTNAWVEVAPTLGVEIFIYSLAVLDGKIYGGTRPNGKLYEWNGTNAWVEVAPTLGAEDFILSLAVLDGKIYGGTYPNGKLYEWNGTNAWVEVASKLGTETSVYSLAVLDGKIYGGTQPTGRLYEWNGTNAWVEVAPQFNSETFIYSLAVLDGKIYGGTQPTGRLYEWNGTDAWVEVAPQFREGTYIYSLAVLDGKIYSGTHPNGKLLCVGLGATLALEPENIQPPSGQWLDSVHNNHAKIPAEGASLIRPQRDGVIEWENTWAASSAGQYVGGVNENIFPADNIRIEWISFQTETTGVDIIVGDQTDTDRYVESTALTNELDVSSPAHRNHDGTNLKLVITPSGIYTGSIKTIVKYTLI